MRKSRSSSKDWGKFPEKPSQKKMRRRILEVLDVRANCGNLKQAKGKAYNATLSESEEDETSNKDQKFLAFVAPHEESKGSQSYYSESSNENREELKEAYKILYVKFLKLRETYQQQVQELNSLRIESAKWNWLIK